MSQGSMIGDLWPFLGIGGHLGRHLEINSFLILRCWYTFSMLFLRSNTIGFPGQIREFVIQINLCCVQIRRFKCSQVYIRFIFLFLALQIYGIFVRIYVCFIQINEKYVLLSLFGLFDLAQHDFLTTRRCTSSILIHL